MPKKLSDAVNRTKIDNTMAKRKRTNYDLQDTTQKTKYIVLSNTNSTRHLGFAQVLQKGDFTCLSIFLEWKQNFPCFVQILTIAIHIPFGRLLIQQKEHAFIFKSNK